MKKKYILYSIICLILIITSSIYTTVTFARYVSSFESSITGSVSVPIIQFSGLRQESNSCSFVLENVSPNMTEREYNFIVNNHLLSVYSEIALKYKITLSTTGNIPLILTLSKNESDLISLSEATTTAQTDYYTLTANQIQDDNYTLTIMWNSEYTSSEYNSMIDEILITVDWEQIN